MKPALKLTPSRMRDYLICPRKFEQQYLVVPTQGKAASSTGRSENAVMSLGSSLHAVLDALHKPGQESQPDGVSILSQDMDRLLSRHWRKEGYANTDEEESAWEQARSILRYYCRSKHVPQGEVLATEAYLSCLTTIKGYTVELSCRADRMELHSDGTLEILDYKVSAKNEVPSVSTLANDLPTFLYFLLAWHYHRADERVRNVRLSLLNLISLEKVGVQYDQHQVVKHRDALGDVVVAALSGPLEPRVNAGCAWCSVHDSCPAWAELDMADLDSFEAWSLRG